MFLGRAFFSKGVSHIEHPKAGSRIIPVAPRNPGNGSIHMASKQDTSREGLQKNPACSDTCGRCPLPLGVQTSQALRRSHQARSLHRPDTASILRLRPDRTSRQPVQEMQWGDISRACPCGIVGHSQLIVACPRIQHQLAAKQGELDRLKSLAPCSQPFMPFFEINISPNPIIRIMSTSCTTKVAGIANVHFQARQFKHNANLPAHKRAPS